MSIHQAASQGYQVSANAYERGRPEYPIEAVQYMIGALGLASACRDDASIYQSGGGVFRSWNPAGVSEVKDVPIADFKSALAAQLKAK